MKARGLYREAAEKVRLEHEMELAADIQRALQPQAQQSGGHFAVASASIPCRAIGGDFFDYFSLARTASSASCLATSPEKDRQRRC